MNRIIMLSAILICSIIVCIMNMFGVYSLVRKSQTKKEKHIKGLMQLVIMSFFLSWTYLIFLIYVL